MTLDIDPVQETLSAKNPLAGSWHDTIPNDLEVISWVVRDAQKFLELLIGSDR
jgi:hypothetical protein